MIEYIEQRWMHVSSYLSVSIFLCTYPRSLALYICIAHQPRHGRVLMWLNLDLTRGMAVSKGEETLATRYHPWAVPRAWLPWERSKIYIWCGYSSTHKKGDNDLLRSATIETPLINWVYVRPLQGHMYRLQHLWCPSHWSIIVPHAMAKTIISMPQT